MIVTCKNLSKTYGTVKALDGIDLEIPEGKIVGLLGPNGSGKTTLIKLIAGLLHTKEGELLVDGEKVGMKTKSIVSYLPERTYFNQSTTVKECLDLFETFYADFDREIAEKMLSSLQIPFDRKIKNLSKGTQEKLQLVVVMSRRAKIYLLDEPIAGVDPAARDYILDTILGNYSEGSTVLISTHLIYDIEAVLDEYIFIHNGHIVEQGRTDAIREEKGISLDQHFRDLFHYVPKEV